MRGTQSALAALVGCALWLGTPTVSAHDNVGHEHGHGHGHGPLVVQGTGWTSFPPAHLEHGGSWFMPHGPGLGWGFPNGAPDQYGWVDYGPFLPIGNDRTPDYYFPRFLAIPPIQAFSSTYWNPYLTQGQRYIPYNTFGPGMMTPVEPYQESMRHSPITQAPTFTGKTDARPTNINVSGSKR